MQRLQNSYTAYRRAPGGECSPLMRTKRKPGWLSLTQRGREGRSGAPQGPREGFCTSSAQQGKPVDGFNQGVT